MEMVHFYAYISQTKQSAFQEKAAQIGLVNDSVALPPGLPPAWAQQAPPYEQLTQEQNVWFTDGSAR